MAYVLITNTSFAGIIHFMDLYTITCAIYSFADNMHIKHEATAAMSSGQMDREQQEEAGYGGLVYSLDRL